MQMFAWTKPGAIPAVYPVYAPLRTCCRAACGSEESQDSLQRSLACLAASDMRWTSDCEIALIAGLYVVLIARLAGNYCIPNLTPACILTSTGGQRGCTCMGSLIVRSLAG